MGLSTLSVSHFRNITQASLRFHPDFNLVVGPNGSGKTSFLEAIYSLGRGRSFKTTNSDKLVQHGQSGFVVSALIATDGYEQRLGIAREGRKTSIRYAGSRVQRASQLSEILPLQIIEPGLHAFFDQGPEIRRRFLEWGVFHVEPRYEPAWRTYRRVLLQRNAALKAHWQKPAIQQWDGLLVEAAMEIDSLRQKYLGQLRSFIQQFSQRHKLTFMADISIEYHRGWRKDSELAVLLNDSLDSDLDRGFTQSGPHRADIRIKLGKSLARDILSRGQQKLFITLLFIAQAMLLKTVKGRRPLLLFDDLAAELDADSRAVLFDVLKSAGCQVFVTAMTVEALAVKGLVEDGFVFHVEHGNIEQVVQ